MSALKTVIQGHTAGSPTEPGKLWTNRSAASIAEELNQYGISLCANTVDLLPHKELKLPPYCSKHNPIDHRLFCHITRSLKAMLLKNIEAMYEAVIRTTISTGLKVIAEIARKIYLPKIKSQIMKGHKTSP